MRDSNSKIKSKEASRFRQTFPTGRLLLYSHLATVQQTSTRYRRSWGCGSSEAGSHPRYDASPLAPAISLTHGPAAPCMYVLCLFVVCGFDISGKPNQPTFKIGRKNQPCYIPSLNHGWVDVSVNKPTEIIR